MKVVETLALLERGTPTILTIGAFDGVHRGHQFLIRQVVDRARTLDYVSMVLTFDPCPHVILRPGTTQLSGGQEKARIISSIGPDVLLIHPFSPEIAAIPAGQFLASILDHVNLAEVWVGADFAFGHKRGGDIDFLIRTGQTARFDVHVVTRRSLGSTPISSTRVREAVSTGVIEEASTLLGHYFTVVGRVVSGFGRGAELGFPTANVQTPEWQMLPATGIYAAYLVVDGKPLPAAVSVGTNPTFDGETLVVEAHVLDYTGNLRDQDVSLQFVARLRDELRFSSVGALVEQMQRDVERTRAILELAAEPGELDLPV